jgi:hypothetical protein
MLKLIIIIIATPSILVAQHGSEKCNIYELVCAYGDKSSIHVIDTNRISDSLFEYKSDNICRTIVIGYDSNKRNILKEYRRITIIGLYKYSRSDCPDTTITYRILFTEVKRARFLEKQRNQVGIYRGGINVVFRFDNSLNKWVLYSKT